MIMINDNNDVHDSTDINIVNIQCTCVFHTKRVEFEVYGNVFKVKIAQDWFTCVSHMSTITQ